MGILRIIFALAVVSVHFRAPLPFMGDLAYGGAANYAVSGFFVLSGFYMSLVLSEKYLVQAGGVRKFYLARFWRLAPALVAVTILSVLLAWYTGTTSVGQWSRPTGEVLERIGLMQPIWQLVVVIANATTFLSDLLLFVSFDQAGAAHAHVAAAPAGWIDGNQLYLVPAAWSLSIELVFYALAPFLARRPSWLLAVLILTGLALRHWIVQVNGLDTYEWRYAFLPTQMHYFLIGILGYRFYAQVLRGTSWASPVGVAALGGYLVWFVMWSEAAVGANEIAHTMIVAAIVPFIFAAFGEVKWDRAIGELSYAIFICHIAAYKLLTLHYGSGAAPPAAISLLAVIGLSLLLYLAVERPIERYRAAFSPPLKAVRSQA